MRVILFFCIFCLGIPDITAQIQASPIELRTNFLRQTQYFYNNRRLIMPGQFVRISEGNREANEAFRIARTNIYVSYALGFTGAALLTSAWMTTWPAKLFGEPNPDVLLPVVAGSGCLLLMIPFAIASQRNIQNGVKLFNNAVSRNNSDKLSLHLMLTRFGCGLILCSSVCRISVSMDFYDLRWPH